MQLHFTYKTTECVLSHKLSYVTHSCLCLRTKRFEAKMQRQATKLKTKQEERWEVIWMSYSLCWELLVIWKIETKSPETSEATRQVSSWGNAPFPHFFPTCFCPCRLVSLDIRSFSSRAVFDRNSSRFLNLFPVSPTDIWLMMLPSLVLFLIVCPSHFPSFINSFSGLDL